jgi:hypothetical protein
MGYLDLSRRRTADESPDGTWQQTDYGINGINGQSPTPDSRCEKSAKSASALAVAAAEYGRLGEQIDALFDQAKAAKERGDMAEGERLGAAVRVLVVGPYLRARERYAAMLDGRAFPDIQRRSD